MRSTATRGLLLAFSFLAAALALATPSLASDTNPPRTKLTYRPRQDFLGQKQATVRLRCNETATAIASGQLEIGSGPTRKNGRVIYGLTGVTRQIRARMKTMLVLHVPRKTREAAERALAHGEKIVVKVTVSARDAAGNESGKTVAVIRPKLG